VGRRHVRTTLEHSWRMSEALRWRLVFKWNLNKYTWVSAFLNTLYNTGCKGVTHTSRGGKRAPSALSSFNNHVWIVFIKLLTLRGFVGDYRFDRAFHLRLQGKKSAGLRLGRVICRSDECFFSWVPLIWLKGVMNTAGISETAVTLYQTARFHSQEYHSTHFFGHVKNSELVQSVDM